MAPLDAEPAQLEGGLGPLRIVGERPEGVARGERHNPDPLAPDVKQP